MPALGHALDLIKEHTNFDGNDILILEILLLSVLLPTDSNLVCTSMFMSAVLYQFVK